MALEDHNIFVACRIHMSKANNSMHWRNDSNSTIFVLIYIGDLLVEEEHLAAIMKANALVVGRSEMRILNKLQYFFGIETICTPSGILLSLCYCIGMGKCKLIKSLQDSNLNLELPSTIPHYACGLSAT